MKFSNLIVTMAISLALSLGAQNMSAQAAALAEDEKPAAQCTLTLELAPALLGMRLGMSLEETRAAAPGLELSSRRRKPNGTSVSLSARANDEVQGVVNSFLSDKLFEIDALLSSGIKWNSIGDYTLDLSKKFNLPPDAWTREANNSGYKMTCNGFTVEVPSINHVILYDTAAKVEILRRSN